jgi:hypothetical protein
VTLFLLGALVALAGVGIGRFLPARRRTPRAREAVQPVCGCTHHHSFHDPRTGACGGQVYIDGSRGYYGLSKYKGCTCRQYSGPVPLPEYYSPEIAAEGPTS